MSRYLNPHVTQYDGSRYAASNCTPASGANGANAATKGRVAKTGGQVRALVARDEETNPGTPGWTLQDLRLAMTRIDVNFTIRSGSGWVALAKAHDDGYYIAVQGDSDRFTDSTCSGAFDGDHCIGVHPDEDSTGRWRIDDPICRVARYERPEVIRAYAQKFAPTVNWGMFLPIVPLALPDTSTGDDVPIYSVPGRVTARIREGQPLRATPGGAEVAKVRDPKYWYDLVGQDSVGADPSWYLIDHDGKNPLVWVAAVAITERAAIAAPRTYPVVVTVGGKKVVGNVTLP